MYATPPFLPFEDQAFPLRLQPVKEKVPQTRTQDPIVTGTSILAIKYKDGVMIAGDTLASYGSLARFRDVQRIHSVGKSTLIGGSGELSDFQYILDILDQLITGYEIVDDGSHLSPQSIHSYLTRVLYGRRNKFDPLWGQFVLAGFNNGKSFLSLTDLKGTNYEDDTIASGYGNHIARPLMRKAYRPDMTRDEAKELLDTCMRVMFYRDARATNRIQIATVTAEGTWISEPYELSTDWSVGEIQYGPKIKVAPYFDSNSNSVTAVRIT